jgi:hypothetical protein
MYQLHILAEKNQSPISSSGATQWPVSSDLAQLEAVACCVAAGQLWQLLLA